MVAGFFKGINGTEVKVSLYCSNVYTHTYCTYSSGLI